MRAHYMRKLYTVHTKYPAERAVITAPALNVALSVRYTITLLSQLRYSSPSLVFPVAVRCLCAATCSRPSLQSCLPTLPRLDEHRQRTHAGARPQFQQPLCVPFSSLSLSFSRSACPMDEGSGEHEAHEPAPYM